MSHFHAKRNDSPHEWPLNWPGNCPLCGGNDHPQYFKDQFRPYYRCLQCDLIFVPSPWHLDGEAEKSRYDTHENDPSDRGYRNYLGRIIPPLELSLGRDLINLRGLDYGCGPGPALSEMLKAKGSYMSLFDPFYHNDRKTLQGHYDFITCTEVFEHMSRPGIEFDSLISLLNRGAVLAVMTQLVTEKTDFKSWYYRNDETHICYFSRKSFLYLGKSRGVRVDFHGKDIIIMKRQADK